MTPLMKAVRESVAAREFVQGRGKRDYSSVINCLFNNSKSSRFFPRLYNEEECGRVSRLYGDTGGIILGRQCGYCLRTRRID